MRFALLAILFCAACRHSEPADDLFALKKRLELETGCAQLSVFDEQVLTKTFRRDEVVVYRAARIEACGQPFVCTATGETLDCEPALALRPPPQAAGQLEPVYSEQEACGPTNCTGCCVAGVCTQANMDARQCGTGGLQCVDCTKGDDGKNKCGPKYTCVK